MNEIFHPEPRCPSGDCRGQFFILKHYGVICTLKLLELTDGDAVKMCELSHQLWIEKSEGLGLS